MDRRCRLDRKNEGVERDMCFEDSQGDLVGRDRPFLPSKGSRELDAICRGLLGREDIAALALALAFQVRESNDLPSELGLSSLVCFIPEGHWVIYLLYVPMQHETWVHALKLLE